MKTSHAPLRGCLVLAFASVVAVGCVGPSATQPHRYIASSGEYQQVFLTGSHIPVLVPKSPTARLVPTISPLTILTPEEIQRAVGQTFPMH